jgi:Tfp pilus assembly protein PilF/predicted secreted protein
MKRATAILTVILLAAAPAGLAAGGQEGRGTARLSGVVRDEAGGPLAGVQVALVHIESGTINSVVSDAKGRWAVLGLGGGVWRITMTLDGYRNRIEDVEVSQSSRNESLRSVLRRVPAEGPGADSGVGLIEEGNRLFGEKRYDDAILAYRRFLDKHPRQFQVRFNIGRSLQEKGDYDAALAEYARVLDAVGQGSRGLAGSALAAKTIAAVGEIALRKGDRAAARAEFERAIALYPRYADLPVGIGEIYVANGLSGEAVAYFELAARIKPDWPDPWLRLGRARLDLGDAEGAARDLRRYLELAPDAANAEDVRKLLEGLAKN